MSVRPHVDIEQRIAALEDATRPPLSPRPAGPSTGTRTELPVPPEPTVPVGIAIANRASTRTFGDRVLPSGTLAAALVATADPPVVGARVVVARVEDTVPAVYGWEPDRPSTLEPLGGIAAPLWLQPEFHTAAAVIVVVGDITNAAYPVVLQAAGTAIQQAAIAAMLRGIDSSIFFGPLPSARSSLHLVDLAHTPLLALALG